MLSNIEKVNHDADFLEKDRRQREHRRNQSLRDNFTRVLTILIYLVPLTMFVMFLAISTHEILQGNWDTVKNYFTAGVSHIGAFILGYLQKKFLDEQ
jgi:hypothetical protein